MIKTFTLRYPEEMRNRLMAQVGRRGGTMNGLLLTIIWEWLAEQEARENGNDVDHGGCGDTYSHGCGVDGSAESEKA